MNIWDKITSSTSTHDILLLNWAEHHPYLYTIVEVCSPQLYTVATILGVQLIYKAISTKRR